MLLVVWIIKNNFLYFQNCNFIQSHMSIFNVLFYMAIAIYRNLFFMKV